METIELTKYPVYQEMRIDMAAFAQSISVEQVIDEAMNQMLLSLRAYVLAEDREASSKKVTISYEVPVIPEPLAEMFQSLRELPTVTHTETRHISFKRRILYPEANIKIPELGSGRVRVVVEEELPDVSAI